MNWDAVGAVAELGAAVGVIVTLVYLSRQVVHNTQATEFQSADQIVSGYLRALRVFLEPGMAELMLTGWEDRDELSDPDRVRFNNVMATFVLSFQKALEGHRMGVVDDELYEAFAVDLTDLLSLPENRGWWEENRRRYTPRVRAAIERRLAQRDPSRPAVLKGLVKDHQDRTEGEAG